MNRTDTAPNLATLEQILSEVRDRAGIDPAIAEAMHKAVTICQNGLLTVRSATELQLQGALHSIRMGHPGDAVRFIEIAISIQDRWTQT